MAAVPADDRLLIALDADGTVLDADERVSPRVVDEIARLVDDGHEVMLATGRSWSTAGAIVARLGLAPEYVVCANGAVTLRRDTAEAGGYRREYVEIFDASDVLATIRTHLPDAGFMVEDGSGRRRYTDEIAGLDLYDAERVDFDTLATVPASRVVVVSPDHTQEEFLGVVERMGLHRVTYSIGWASWLDISPQGVDKASALERVRTLLGIVEENVVAVGDGRNDIGMLRWASRRGRGVAMGQAPDEVKEAAGETTAPLADDGAARLLAEL